MKLSIVFSHCFLFLKEPQHRKINGSFRLTRGIVERGRKVRAMHAGKVLCAQSSLVKVNADRPTQKTHRSCYVVIRESTRERSLPWSPFEQFVKLLNCVRVQISELSLEAFVQRLVLDLKHLVAFPEVVYLSLGFG